MPFRDMKWNNTTKDTGDSYAHHEKTYACIVEVLSVIKGEKSWKDTASWEKLVSTIGA